MTGTDSRGEESPEVGLPQFAGCISLGAWDIPPFEVACPYLCAHRPRFAAPDGRLPGLRTRRTTTVEWHDGFPWFPGGTDQRLSGVSRSSGREAPGSTNAAPGCLGLRVRRVFGRSGSRDDRQLHSPRWAARGSPGGWRFLGAKLSGSNNDVPLSAAATVRGARPTGSSGRCVGSPSVSGRHPGGTGLASRLQPGTTTPRGRDPGRAKVDSSPSGTSRRVRSSRHFRCLRCGQRARRYRRSRGLVPQVLPRPGGHPGHNPLGRCLRDFS